MLLKDIQKPNDFENFLSTMEYWRKFHTRNAMTSIEEVRSPKTLGDKFSWCVMHCKYNNKLFRKDTAKDEVIKIFGNDKYVIPNYQVCNSVNEIDWDALIGKSFVIKPNNEAESRGVIIQKRKLKTNDLEDLKRKVQENDSLKKRRIVIEKCLLSPKSKNDWMKDYKFWCFNGKPVFCEIQQSVFLNGAYKHYSCIFDMNFKKTKLEKDYTLNFETLPKKPKNFNEMVEVATKICQGMPVLRVDLYNVDGKIYFGECQKIYGYHCRFKDKAQNKELCDMLDISNMSSDVSNYVNRQYFVKNSFEAQEAKEILGCDDDEFEFCFAKSNIPLFYKSGHLDSDFIYKINGLWYKQENFVDESGKKTFKILIYNRRTKFFEELRTNEAKRLLNNISSSLIENKYDEEGDVVYYNKYDDSRCIKYVNGNWIKNEYETIKVKKATSQAQIYNDSKKQFVNI